MLDFYETLFSATEIKTKTLLELLDKLIDKDINEINEQLNSLGLLSKLVNINELYKELPNYQFIILSYRDISLNNILIDPNYSKFKKIKDEQSPLYFEAWPSEILQNINPILLKDLNNKKYSFIDDKELNDYLKSFTNKNTNVNIETIIFEKYKNNRKI